MKNAFFNTSDPRKLSLFVSLITSIFLLVLYLLFLFFLKNIQIHWLALALILLSYFAFSYFIFKFILQKFIYEKIRLIYKTIRRLKLDEDEKPEINFNSDIIAGVKNEVEVWSKKHKKEISSLKEQETFRREYIGNIAHELKNPVFNLQGYIYALSHGATESRKLREKYLSRMDKNINRIITIIEDLDTISELETTDIKPNFERFDLLQLNKEVIELFSEKAAKKNIQIHFRENYYQPLYVIGDIKRINQVFINIIENAIKYSYKNSRIKISFFDMDKNYLVEITDQGPGISKTDLPRIFERFYRTDKARSRNKGGSGLGLSIVKHIIEAHKETINVRSTIGVGTTFAFTIKKA